MVYNLSSKFYEEKNRKGKKNKKKKEKNGEEGEEEDKDFSRPNMDRGC